MCSVCGVLTSRPGSRCTTHARQSNRSRHNAFYSTRTWQRLSARVLRAWRGEHGEWCPGYQRPAHQATDLTVDHVVPLAAGGAPFDIANTAVLCRSCNSTKGASTDRRGVAHTATRLPPDRNGIGVLGTRSDLLDRTIELELPRIPDDRRQDEAQFWAAFEREQPTILGALLDAVSGAIGRLDEVKLERAPRMADFARWVVAAEPALGWPTGSFLKAYTGNRDAIHEIALDAAVIVLPMRTLLESGEFLGTATELLDRLASIVGESATRRKGWPGNATSLSRGLARIAPNLRSVGIDVEKRRESHGRRLIAIRPVPETPSHASPPSPAPDAGDATSADGDATGASDEAGVTDDGARGDAGDAGDGLLPSPSPADLDVAREALRIFADDLTDESAARLRAVVDGSDGFDWGRLA
jgi:5-methylcytosine-specific restriction endonuclease McrA